MWDLFVQWRNLLQDEEVVIGHGPHEWDMQKQHIQQSWSCGPTHGVTSITCSHDASGRIHPGLVPGPSRTPFTRSPPGSPTYLPSMLLDCGGNLECLVGTLGNDCDHFGISSHAAMTTEMQRRKWNLGSKGKPPVFMADLANKGRYLGHITRDDLWDDNNVQCQCWRLCTCQYFRSAQLMFRKPFWGPPIFQCSWTKPIHTASFSYPFGLVLMICD